MNDLISSIYDMWFCHCQVQQKSVVFFSPQASYTCAVICQISTLENKSASAELYICRMEFIAEST